MPQALTEHTLKSFTHVQISRPREQSLIAAKVSSGRRCSSPCTESEVSAMQMDRPRELPCRGPSGDRAAPLPRTCQQTFPEPFLLRPACRTRHAAAENLPAEAPSSHLCHLGAPPPQQVRSCLKPFLLPFSVRTRSHRPAGNLEEVGRTPCRSH